MPEFTLRANGIPFTITAPDRQAAAAGLAEAIEEDPTLVDRKAERLGLSQEDVATVGRVSRGESAERPVDKGRAAGFAAQSTAEGALEGIRRLPEQMAQLAIDTFGSEEQAQLAKGQIDAKRADRLEAAAGRVESVFGADSAALDTLVDQYDRNADLGQAAIVTLATGGLGGGALTGQVMRSTVGRVIKEGLTKRALFAGGRFARAAAPTAAIGTGFGLIVPTAGETVEERQEDRVGAAKFGVFLGLGLQAGIGTIGGIRNLVTSPVRRALESAEPGAERIARATQERGTLLTLGQKTGNNFLINLENFLTGTRKNRFIRGQVDTLLKSVKDKLKGVATLDRPSYGKLVKKAGAAIESRVAALNVIRRDVWKKGMARVDRLSIEEGNLVVQPTSLKGVLADIEADMGSAALSQIELGAGMKTLGDEINGAIQSGGATVRQVNEWMKGIEFAKRSGNIFDNGTAAGLQQVYLNQLRGGLMDDIARLGAQGRPSKAMNELLKVRDDYRQVVGEIRQFEGESALALLRNPRNSDDAIRAIGQLDDEGQTILRRTLLKSDDGKILHEELSSSLVRRALDDSFVTKAGEMRRFDLNKFRRNLRAQAVPGKPGEHINISKFLSPQDVKNAEESANIAAKMMNLEESLGKTGVTLGDIAINAVSRSAEFVARTVTRLITGSGKGAEWLLLSREGQEWLQQVALTRQAGNSKALNRLVAMGAYASGLDEANGQEQKKTQSLAAELGL